MKVSFKQLTGVVSLMTSIAHSDEILDKESESVILFLRGFKIDDEKKREIINAAIELEMEEASEIVKGLDQASKQEVSNLLFNIMMIDGVVSGSEAAMFMSIISDSELPAPDTQEWLDWISDKDAEEEVFSNEETASSAENIACFYVIEPSGNDAYFMGKCWAYSHVNNRPVSEEVIARDLLGCTKSILLTWKNLPILNAVAKDMGISDIGVFRAYIAKSPSNYVENKAASKILGKKIYGPCLIRFISNEGKYLELVESNCEELHRHLRSHLDCPMTYNTKLISL